MLNIILGLLDVLQGLFKSLKGASFISFKRMLCLRCWAEEPTQRNGLQVAVRQRESLNKPNFLSRAAAAQCLLLTEAFMAYACKLTLFRLKLDGSSGLIKDLEGFFFYRVRVESCVTEPPLKPHQSRKPVIIVL